MFARNENNSTLLVVSTKAAKERSPTQRPSWSHLVFPSSSHGRQEDPTNSIPKRRTTHKTVWWYPLIITLLNQTYTTIAVSPDGRYPPLLQYGQCAVQSPVSFACIQTEVSLAVCAFHTYHGKSPESHHPQQCRVKVPVIGPHRITSTTDGEYCRAAKSLLRAVRWYWCFPAKK